MQPLTAFEVFELEAGTHDRDANLPTRIKSAGKRLKTGQRILRRAGYRTRTVVNDMTLRLGYTLGKCPADMWLALHKIMPIARVCRHSLCSAVIALADFFVSC